MKYRNSWTVDKLSSPFTFEEDGLKGKLKKENGNGWQVVINGFSKVSSQQQCKCVSSLYACANGPFFCCHGALDHQLICEPY